MTDFINYTSCFMAMCCFWLSILCSVCYDVCHHRHVRYKGTVAAILMKLSALWHCEDALQVCSPIHRYYANGTYQKSAPEKKTAGLPVSSTSDMEFGTEFFWCQFLVTNRACCIFVPVYGTDIWCRCVMGITVNYAVTRSSWKANIG